MGVVGAIAAPQAAQAVGATKVAVQNDGPANFWEGKVRNNGPATPGIPECQTVHCHKAELKVDLPSDTWRRRPGGVQVAIRWDIATEGALSLFVYRNGALVAKSTAGVGIAQSVLLRSAVNGTYQVYVAYGVTFGAIDPDPAIAYEGLAEVEYDPRVQPLRDLLPDLAALPQENVTYDNPGSIFGDTAQPGQSCFDSEIPQPGTSMQCLRFDQVLRNRGKGPLELRFDRETGVFGDEDATQRVYRSDGAFYDRDADQVEWHAIHSHYHFKGFAQSDLWHSDGAGHVVGTAPAAVGDKVSFCVSDTDLIDWGLKGDGPLSYPAPDCLEPKQVIGTTEFFSYGMTPGWADRYNWYLPGQMIDTYGISDGTYILFTTVDPENKLLEANEANNCGSVIVVLTGLATSQPHAELLGTGPSCDERP
ncbi:MAG TPA: hypothetical protein VHI50_16040 [Micromonosporaceae bacterium]|nr:hypothetical protein [Micromonosporaceae bacterium]